MSSQKFGLALCRDSAVRSCWPLRAMPELLGKRKWSMMQDMSYKQRVLLDAKLANRAGLDPNECRAIAVELGLAFQQVCVHDAPSLLADATTHSKTVGCDPCHAWRPGNTMCMFGASGI